MRTRPNVPAGLIAGLWLLVVLIPVYLMVRDAFSSQKDYLQGGPIGLPNPVSWDNFVYSFQNGFGLFLLNSAIITVGTVAFIVLLVPPLAFALVRGRSRWMTTAFQIMLFGLAIPAQVVVIPLNFLITQVGLYDSLIGVILPTASFAIPLTTLILTGSMREIGGELYEAIALDGAGAFRTFFRLVLPLSRGGIATIVVYSALQAWNSYLIPLTLTRSSDLRVATLGLGLFQQEHNLNVPGLMSAIVLTILPIFLVYIFARRALIRGLMGVGGK